MKKTNEVWTIGSILKWTGQYFGDKGVESPRLDAEVLLSHILGKERIRLYVDFDQPLQPQELTAFRLAVKQRAARLPVAYITGRKEFMGLPFTVTPAVLIPRPDTEILVEAALERLKKVEQPKLLDIGTGSGAIIIALLSGLPAACGTAVDLSAEALAVAGINAAAHQVAERLRLCRGDLCQPVAGQRYDAILSNPPYIPDGDLDGLAPEVRQEPQLALAGGADGLDFYRRLIREAADYLKPDGFMALEVGAGQAAAVAELAAAQPLMHCSAVLKDYGGIDRVVILTRSREE